LSKSHVTPGPWKLEGKNPIRVTAANAGNLATMFGGLPDDPEQLANARLAANASVMFEYVEKLAAAGDPEAKAIVDRFNAPVP